MKKIKRGEIRLCNLGDGIGSIQGGLRPALVIQNNKGNKHSPIVIVIPITSKTDCKAKLPTHLVLTKSMGLKQQSLLLTEQIITINRKDVGKLLTTLSPKVMEVVDKKIGISINLKPQKHKNLYFRKKHHQQIESYSRRKTL